MSARKGLLKFSMEGGDRASHTDVWGKTLPAGGRKVQRLSERACAWDTGANSEGAAEAGPA